mgnify:CR=1 FL=1
MMGATMPNRSPSTAPQAVDAGLFVVLEGPEGAGKSTQVRHLAARSREAGLEPLVTKEPGGTPVGERVRHTLLLEPELAIAPLTEFLLYSASRAEHVAQVIRPALAAGRTVVCDRFYGSSVAYQGYGRGLDLEFIAALNARVAAGLQPDLVLLLDLPPAAGLARIARRGTRDRLERADLEFHERVRRGFLAQARADERWRVLDAETDETELAEAVWRAFAERLERAR